MNKMLVIHTLSTEQEELSSHLLHLYMKLVYHDCQVFIPAYKNIKWKFPNF